MGVGLVDSFGDLVPPRSLDAERDGMMGWCKREGEVFLSVILVISCAVCLPIIPACNCSVRL